MVVIIAGNSDLNGEYHKVPRGSFEVQEDMAMTFRGNHCDIVDGNGNAVPGGQLTRKDGVTQRILKAGYRCHIVGGRVTFKRVR